MISAAMLILMVSCGQHKTSADKNDSDERIPVNVAKSESREYIPSIELSGTAYADKEANLGAALPGRVEKVYFPEGSQVKKGDLLTQAILIKHETVQLEEVETFGKDGHGGYWK